MRPMRPPDPQWKRGFKYVTTATNKQRASIEWLNDILNDKAKLPCDDPTFVRAAKAAATAALARIALENKEESGCD